MCVCVCVYFGAIFPNLKTNQTEMHVSALCRFPEKELIFYFLFSRCFSIQSINQYPECRVNITRALLKDTVLLAEKGVALHGSHLNL